jgi:hypothetical protein
MEVGNEDSVCVAALQTFDELLLLGYGKLSPGGGSLRQTRRFGGLLVHRNSNALVVRRRSDGHIAGEGV